MNKPPPYQPTTQQMLAQAQAAQQAQQQTYLQQAQLAQAQQQTGVQHGANRYPNPTTSSSSTGPAYLAYLGTGGTIFYALTGTGQSPSPRDTITVEEAGIRAGEIIAYRAWRLHGKDDLLHSMFVDYQWTPEGQRIADERLNPYHGNGFHAFKTPEQIGNEYPQIIFGPTVVHGEVALWGEVYEHEIGYRAEFARVTRLISIGGGSPESGLRRFKFWNTDTLTRLRRKYGVAE